MVKPLRMEGGDIDDVDARILEALVHNARISIAELARTVGMSAPSVSERVRRLEETGAITGYTAIVNPAVLGRPLAIMLRIRPVPGKLREVADLIKNIPDIVECVRVTGEDCYVARAHVRSVDDLEALIDRIVPHSMTTTSIIQSSPVERRLPPLSVN
ncbi:MAG: Lrp/AsnC family transcriptional regulator [Pseudomonadota bacterium]